MTREERKIALYCLKASSDYHSEVCEECVKYPNCDHTGQDDVTETIIKALEQEPCEDDHDGCKDCKYETYPDYYYPCCSCKQNYVDEWEKKPHWNHGVCDKCGYDWSKDAPIASVPNFCPNCGSHMEIER